MHSFLDQIQKNLGRAEAFMTCPIYTDALLGRELRLRTAIEAIQKRYHFRPDSECLTLK